MAHTPGPWAVVTKHPKGVLDRCILASGYYVATVHDTAHHAGCWDSDARLIAAAPDLLAALKGVLRVADRKTAEFDAARAAIAKAEGG